MKKHGENNLNNINEVIELLEGIFKSTNGGNINPKIKINGHFSKQDLVKVQSIFSSYITKYEGNDIKNLEFIIYRNKKNNEIEIHEFRPDNQIDRDIKNEVEGGKLSVFKLIKLNTTNYIDHYNFLNEEIEYLKSIRAVITECIGTIEYDKNFNFGGLDIKKINYIQEFILNYYEYLSDIKKENTFINIFLDLFEEITTNHNNTLGEYEKNVLDISISGKYFYRNMKTEIHNFINKLIDEVNNKKTSN